MRVIDFFDRSAALYPGRACAIDDDGTVDYAHVEQDSPRIAHALQAAGMGIEDKVAVYAPNCTAAMRCIVGVLRSGAAWLPLNARNAVKENIGIMRRNDCRFVLFHSDFTAEAAAMREAVPELAGTVCIDGESPGAPFLDRWIADHPPRGAYPGTDRDHTFKLALSGGTSGLPKGVEHSNLNGQIMLSSLLIALPHRGVPVYLCAAPITHAAGNLALWILAAGGATVLMRNADALAILQNIERHRATTLFLPPTAIYNMLAHPLARSFDYRSLQYFIYGAAPMSVGKLKQAIHIFGPVMTQIYSQAEATMALTIMRPEHHAVVGDLARETRLRSAGLPGPLVLLAIMDDHGRELPPGEVGEICIRGDLVCKGYYRNPEATRQSRRDGWLLTSDSAWRDEEGFVYIVDRKRDMIITGGFNVYSTEIEQLLTQHPGVHDCAVIGVPDEKWGEAIKAVVVAAHDGVTADELIAMCKAELGSVKAPKSIEFRAELPKSPNGKVLKRVLREEFWAGQERALTA